MKVTYHLVLVLLFLSCNNDNIPNSTSNLLANNGQVTALVEIPSGTTTKWEFNKTTKQIERDSINNQPRTI